MVTFLFLSGIGILMWMLYQIDERFDKVEDKLNRISDKISKL